MRDTCGARHRPYGLTGRNPPCDLQVPCVGRRPPPIVFDRRPTRRLRPLPVAHLALQAAASTRSLSMSAAMASSTVGSDSTASTARSASTAASAAYAAARQSPPFSAVWAARSAASIASTTAAHAAAGSAMPAPSWSSVGGQAEPQGDGWRPTASSAAAPDPAATAGRRRSAASRRPRGRPSGPRGQRGWSSRTDRPPARRSPGSPCAGRRSRART